MQADTPPTIANTARSAVWRRVSAWLTFAWPCWWLGRSLLEAFPALLVAGTSSYTIAMFGMRPDGMMARVFPPGAVTSEYQPGMSAAIRDPFGVSLILIPLLVLGLLALRRRWPSLGLAASLTAAALVLAILQSSMGAYWFRGRDADSFTLLRMLVGAGLSLPVFRALAAETSFKAYAGRIALPLATVFLPGFLIGIFWGRGIALEQILLSFGVTVILVGIGALWSTKLSPPHRLPGFRSIGVGVAASAAVLLLGFSPRSMPRIRPEQPAQAAAPVPADTPYPKLFFQRGVSYTSEWPDSYDSAKAHEMLTKLRARGVDAIALVPYGSARNGQSELRFGGWERDESILALANTAHSLGIRVMLKPQVWIRGGYPGDFDLPDDESRNAWFAQYERLTLHYAELARRAHADLFCIGTEFAKLTKHEDFWRQLIAKVRKAYPGPITYAANFGAEFEDLAFWDALDYIGLNNYYPLPDSLECHGIVAKVEAVQKRFGKPVIFTEGGYSSYEGGHRKPWSENEGPLDLETQAAAYDSVLKAFWDKPWFYGAYWWKVGSNAFGGPLDRTHTPWGKPAMDIVAKWYRKPVQKPVR